MRNKDAVKTEGYGYITEFQGDIVQSIWDIGIWTGGMGNTVQASGNTPGSIWQQLASNYPKQQEDA